MALVVQRVFDEYHQYMKEHRDTRSASLPLTNEPWPVMILIATYLFVVLKAGPEYMANRKPFDLKNVIRVYNVLQVIANGAFFVTIMYLLLQRQNFSLVCQPVDYSTTREGFQELYLSYGYFLLKVLDLADTVFFVLRKKQSHVSFLHVYHHAVMVLMTYLAVVFVPGGHVFMLGVWNSLVHAVMYFYYFLASYQSQDTIWWKKYLTRLQLVQFVHLGFHFGRPALSGMDCGFPRIWHWVGFGQAIFICSMFLDFYVKAYVAKNRKGSSKSTKMR
ncbi:elongation of very long chain fatty acids protein 4 [Culex quinquefasciatus]|uniref:Elongation of very long chain fatty acids protein n=1 Tax=Culex quinquefasciatus TaxID=7176 RepID=B0X2X9_CULQU|nr:elongation of very long chain fatty acids protein AAEL008004 [Culex quinquefasciatus]EDS39481.1 elongation of very long chain fatty acids protein 4 [Culex quinquefasciatus]|eukprot:XP_001864001.1 elongation of very long chain fatty acids protein 4 [Culex quinquefasciatus]